MYSSDSAASSGGPNLSHQVDTDGERKLLLQAPRIARRQFQIELNVIDSVGVAFRGGMIAPDEALAWLHDEGMLDCVDLEPAEQREAA